MKNIHILLIAAILLLVGCEKQEENIAIAEQVITEKCGSINRQINLDIAFVIDKSGSMERNDPDNKRISEASYIVDEMLEEDSGTVISFANSTELLLPEFTSDKSEIQAALNSITSDERYTNLSLGLGLALNEFPLKSNNQRVIIALTDGENAGEVEDLTLRYNEQSIQIANLASQQGVTIYTIGLGEEVDKTLLEEIANVTGGKYFFAEDHFALADIYKRVNEEIQCTEEVRDSLTLQEELESKLEVIKLSTLTPDQKLSQIVKLANAFTNLKEEVNLDNLYTYLNELESNQTNIKKKYYGVICNIIDNYGLIERQNLDYPQYKGLLYADLVNLSSTEEENLLLVFRPDSYSETDFIHRKTDSIVIEIWGNIDGEAKLIDYIVNDVSYTIDGIYDVNLAKSKDGKYYLHFSKAHGRDEYYYESHDFINLNEERTVTEISLDLSVDIEYTDSGVVEYPDYKFNEIPISKEEYDSKLNLFEDEFYLFTASQMEYGYNSDDSEVVSIINNTMDNIIKSSKGFLWNEVSDEDDISDISDILYKFVNMSHYDSSSDPTGEQMFLELLLADVLSQDSNYGGFEEKEVNEKSIEYFNRKIDSSLFINRKSFSEVGVIDRFEKGYYQLVASDAFFPQFNNNRIIRSVYQNGDLYYVFHDDYSFNIMAYYSDFGDGEYDISLFNNNEIFEWPKQLQIYLGGYSPRITIMRKIDGRFIIVRQSEVPFD